MPRDLAVRSATEAGSPDKPNEDAIAIAGRMVVVADGSTSRTDTGCIHGVAWYAQQLAESIARRADLHPTESLAAAIEETAGHHRSTCDLSHPGTPSAAVGIVSVDEQTLRYLVLADVTILIETNNGLTVVSDDRVSHTATAERQTANALPAGSVAKAEALTRMKHAELAARNRVGGFWVATDDPAVVAEALSGEIPVEHVRRVALLTDGAARAVDLFGCYDWAGMLQAIDHGGPAKVVHQVRACEVGDAEARSWPRNKISDDATAVILNLNS